MENERKWSVSVLQWAKIRLKLGFPCDSKHKNITIANGPSNKVEISDIPWGSESSDWLDYIFVRARNSKSTRGQTQGIIVCTKKSSLVILSIIQQLDNKITNPIDPRPERNLPALGSIHTSQQATIFCGEM